MNHIEALIRDAFSEVQYPGDDHLTVHGIRARAHDETWQLLHGLTWDEMPVVAFFDGDTPIPDLTPEAFHYYLPALLLACLDPELKWYVVHSLLFNLDPNSAVGVDYDFSYQQHRFMSLFSDDQRRAVVAAITELRREFADDEEADSDEVERIYKAFSVKSEK